MSHIRIFEHPANQSQAPRFPPLSITGSLPRATPGEVYEGRLTINNPAGDCTARLLSGTLPPGASVSVDNASHEVVVAWPEYGDGGSTVPNGGFEDGALGWELGPGLTISSEAVNSGGACLRFGGYSGVSRAVHKSKFPCSQSILSATVAFRQGASAAGNLSGRAMLLWYDASGALVEESFGPKIDSASGDGYRAATITASKPSGATQVSIGFEFNRKRENRPARIDDFAWTLASEEVGINVETTIGPITIRVRDSLGREADWTGTILVTSDAWKTVFDAAPSNATPGWPGYTLRGNGPMLPAGSKIRLTFGSAGGSTMTIDKATVGMRASSGDYYDYASTPSFITVGGSQSFSIPAGGTVVSDEISLAIPGGVEMVYAFFSNAGIFSTVPRVGTLNGYRSGDFTTTVDASGFGSAAAAALYCIKKVEVFGPP